MFKKVLFCAMAVSLLACEGEGAKPGEAGKPGASGAPAAAAAPAKGGLIDVELTPLPLKMKVPPGGMGAMDMSMGDHKSVTIDVGGGASLNVSEEKGDFASVKKSYAGDTVMFPFKKWVKETDTIAVEHFEIDGKTAFIGLSMKDVGGKKYVCKTTGLAGIATAELAEAHLKFCDSLAAK